MASLVCFTLICTATRKPNTPVPEGVVKVAIVEEDVVVQVLVVEVLLHAPQAQQHVLNVIVPSQHHYGCTHLQADEKAGLASYRNLTSFTALFSYNYARRGGMVIVTDQRTSHLATIRVACHLLGGRLAHVDVLTMHVLPEVEPVMMRA